MKFSEKLQTLRKDMKMSQEQLADMLDVSRQSVSKWESGQTYPEMDKLLELCKIFKCTLDDLTNDSIKEIKQGKKEKNNLSNLVDSLLDLIKRSYSMLKKMKLKNIIGCILEMFVIFLIILLFHNIVNYIYQLGAQIFIHFGETASNIICSIWKTLLEIIYIILGVIVFIYIYKIRYLDRYDNIKIITSNEKEEKLDEISEKKQEKVIIERESSFGFFDVLGSIVLFFIKVFIFFVALPFIFSLIFLGMCFIISTILLFSGVTYIGINFIIIATIVLNLVILYLVYYFIFNKKIKIKGTLIVILSSLLLLGIGMGITTLNIANTSFINDVNTIEKETKKEQIFVMNKDLYIEPDNYNINYILDNTLDNNIKIEVIHYKNYNDVNINNYNNVISFSENYLTKEINKNMYKTIINDLKNKSFHNYALLFNIKVNIYANQDNIDVLQKNSSNYLNLYEENQNYCDNEINNLESSLTEKDNIIFDLESKKEALENENSILKDKIETYKNRLSSLLEE